MGYQEREQREFQGIVNTRVGAGAPRWSAEDAVNIDFSFHSIRGRPPTERATPDLMPVASMWFDADSCAQSTYFTDNFSLESLSDDAAETAEDSFCVRVYISQIDFQRLDEWPTNTEFVICESMGDTETNSLAAINAGWVIYLYKFGAGTFRLGVRRASEPKAGGAIARSALTTAWTGNVPYGGKNDVYCIEWWWETDHSDEHLDVYRNGSNTADIAVTSTSICTTDKIRTSGGHRLNIGAWAPNLQQIVGTSVTPNGHAFLQVGGGDDQISLQNGDTWSGLGVSVGDYIIIQSAEDAGNNGRHEVLAVASNDLDVDVGSTLTTNADDNTAIILRETQHVWKNCFIGTISPVQILKLNTANGVLPRRRWESVPPQSQTLGNLGNFAAYIKVSVNSGVVSEALTDFPFPLEITSNDMRTVANGGNVTSASGFDIVPYDDALRTTQFDFQLVDYDGTTGTVKMWVKADVSDTTDTDIFLFFGNTSLTTDQGDITTTGTFESYATTSTEAGWWHADFEGLTPQTDAMTDVTGLGNLLDHSNTATFPGSGPSGSYNVVTGTVHQAVQASSGTNPTSYGNSSMGTLTDESYTMTIWCRADAVPLTGFENIMDRLNVGSGQGLLIAYDRTGSLGLNSVYGAHYEGGVGFTRLAFGVNWNNSPARNVWNMYTIRYDSATDTFEVFLDGASVTSATTIGAPAGGNTQSVFGRSISNQGGGDKSYDEPRIAFDALADGWIAAEYESQKDSGVPGTGRFLHNQQNTAFSPYAQFALSVEPQDAEEWTIDTVGQTGYTDAGSGQFYLNPPPVLVADSQVNFTAQHGGQIDASGLRIDETQVWGYIMGFRVQAPSPNEEFATTGLNTTRILNFGVPSLIAKDYALTAIDPSGSFGYRLQASLTVFDKTTSVGTNSTLTTGDLQPGKYYRIAHFFERNFDLAIDTTQHEVWVEDNGTWTSAGSVAAATGTTEIVNLITMGGHPSIRRLGPRWDMTDFRLHGNIGTFPASAGAVSALDTYPPDSLVWPGSLQISIDAASANVRTDTLDDGRLRLLRITDNKSGIHDLRTNPTKGRSRLSAVKYLAGGNRHPSHGIHTATIAQGDRITQTLDSVNETGSYRYDFELAEGTFYQGPPAQGSPDEGVSGIDVKDRSIYFGGGMNAWKLAPMGSSEVGYDPPDVAVDVAGATGSTGAGGLVQNTDYRYRFSCYNSQTGQESNLNSEDQFFEISTGASEDTLDIDITRFVQPRGEDWDTINVYRAAQVSGLYHLEQSLPKPYVLPPEGADISFTSGVAESELLLKVIEAIDNDPPQEFTAAALAGRSLVTGGSGPHPGWAYYSKSLLQESFPPLNVWQLDDDDGNRVTAIKQLFGRIVIFKQRSIYAARDDAPETGEQPALVHEGRGCVSARAVTLADNRLFFVSPDRSVYATDGVELFDVSTPSIRTTMDELTTFQMSRIQLAHHARKKQIWMSVPFSETSQRRQDIWVFDYTLGRWSKYELPHNSISTGSEGTGLRGEHALIGTPYYAYQMGTGREAAESDTSALVFQNDYSKADGEWITLNNQVYGFTSTSFQWESDIEGMPVIAVIYPGTDAFAGDPRDHPLFEEIGAGARLIHYTWVAKVTSSAPYEFWFNEPVPDPLVVNRALVMVGQQYRRYLSQWYSPQGEGMDYLFSGYSWISDQRVRQAAMDNVYRVFSKMDPADEDDPGLRVANHDATEWSAANNDQYPEHSFSYRERGRRIRYEIQSGIDRTRELEIQRSILRYRVRGPRRWKGLAT